MKSLILICCVTVVTVVSENDEWVWNDDRQAKSGSTKSKYQVNENLEELDNDGPLIGFRPQNTGPYGPNSRPILPGYQGNKGVLVGPGGPTGIIKRPHYPSNTHVDGISDSGFLPSWIKQDPRYREYDTCRCRYSFNCPSTGLKFGSCSKDKRYCCFNSRKYPALVPSNYGEGQRPSYPGSPNKYGPVNFAPSNYYGNRRPQGNIHSGHRNPQLNYHSSGENSNYYLHGNPHENRYDYDSSQEYDTGSHGFDFYARSLNKNQTSAESKADGNVHAK